MIKFIVQHPETNRQILGLILEEGNIERLKKGMPIHFHIEQMNITSLQLHEVLIMYYKTQEEAIQDLNNRGYISNDTKIQKEISTKN